MVRVPTGAAAAGGAPKGEGGDGLPKSPPLVGGEPKGDAASTTAVTTGSALLCSLAWKRPFCSFGHKPQFLST